MIALSLGDLVLAYAGALVLGLFLLSFCGWFLRGSSERRRRRRHTQCMFCGSIYESPAAEPLPACPHCSRPNERIPPPAV